MLVGKRRPFHQVSSSYSTGLHKVQCCEEVRGQSTRLPIRRNGRDRHAHPNTDVQDSSRVHSSNIDTTPTRHIFKNTPSYVKVGGKLYTEQAKPSAGTGSTATVVPAELKQ